MDETKIREIVDEILAETELGIAPIKIIAIANFYGFEVYELEFDDDISGVIMADEQKIDGFDTNRVIVVNAAHSGRRNRFTIAHELGHYFLSGRQDKCFAHRDDFAYDEDERDANSFASALLMPEDEVRRKLNSLQEDLGKPPTESQKIAYIADVFQVSQAAAEVRLKKLQVLAGDWHG